MSDPLYLARKYARMENFIAQRLASDLYPEAPSQLHTQLTRQQIEWLDSRWPLVGRSVLDVGCGQGVALEVFAERGMDATGITFGADLEACRAKGFVAYPMDMSFLEFAPASFDLIWARHALEHSLFPMFTLHGFREVLRDDGRVYIEVPAPDTVAAHQDNPNHYACFTAQAWLSQFRRSGFSVLEALQINVPLTIGLDTYYVFLLGKSPART